MARRRGEVPDEVLAAVPVSRRSFVKKLVLGAFAVPIVSSFGLPVGGTLGTGPYPVTKDDCKNGGWQRGGYFRNQGDCVSYVATGGRNRPAG